MADKPTSLPGLLDEAGLHQIVHTETILGIEFRFLEIGVVVDPNYHDVNNPIFLEALRQACAISQEVCDFSTLLLEVRAKKVNFFYLDDADLDSLIERIDKLLSTGRFSAALWLSGLRIQCDEEASKREAMKAREETNKAARRGYVYILLSSAGLYKIGRTQNPANRIAAIKAALPFEIHSLATVHCADMYEAEKHFLTAYQANRVSGEWFKLTDAQAMDICWRLEHEWGIDHVDQSG